MEFETIPENSDEKEFDIFEYWGIIVRRWWIIAVFAGIVVLIVGINTFTATPIYQATTTLLIEEDYSKVMSYEDEFGYRTGWTDLRFFNTQLRLLKSKALAERVVQKMNLSSRPEFGAGQKPKKSLMGEIKKIVTLRWLRPEKDQGDNGRDSARVVRPANPYSGLTGFVQGGLRVNPIGDTKLVQVSFRSPYPTLTAQIVNTVAEEFIDFVIERKYRATQQATDFLSEQISALRDDLTVKERELQRYGQEKDIFFSDDNESTAVRNFQDISNAFTQAQIERYKAEASYRELKDLNIDALPQFINNPLIQNLKEEYVRRKNEYNEKLETFKPDYPEMISLRARLESLRDELTAEIQKAVDAAQTEYQTAYKRESNLKALLDQQKNEVARMNSNAIFYNSIRIEVENMRKTLNTLVARQSQTLVSARLEGMKTSNISIIDKAEVPGGPILPNKRKNLLMALLIGIFGGIGLCFLIEYIDSSVKGIQDVERLTGLPSLGVIPYYSLEGRTKRPRFKYHYEYEYSYDEKEPEKVESELDKKGIELINYKYPKLSIAEDYRTIRTSIMLSNVDNPPQVMSFTSAMPKEGKSATVANMAVAFSQLQKSVLIVDADLRKPRQHRIFRSRNHSGVSTYLIGKTPIQKAIFTTSVKNIKIFPSGPIPPNPSEMLNSKKMKILLTKLKEGFDVILIDTPPVLAVIDPIIVATIVDAAIFVLRASGTPKKPFVQAVDELKKSRAEILGVIFNEVKQKERENYRYSRYGTYRAYYTDYHQESGTR